MVKLVQPGDVLLGKYEVERILGRGGMGIVVAARHLELGELFAMKFLLPAALEQPQAVDRFVREGRAAARLKSPHIAKVHDAGRLETGAPYLVMEYLDGTDLRTVVRRRGALPVDEVLICIIQVCEAVAEAHALGIVHRDLKPANLFVTRAQDDTPWIKVLDFGISKQLVPEHAHELTNTDMILGSPTYMSPEQLRCSKHVDGRADIWSLGVVLYELLTGSTPFRGNGLLEVVGQVLQHDPVPPSRLRHDLPAALDTIVLRCLDKQAHNRFETAGELALALRTFRSGVAAAAAALPTPITSGPVAPPSVSGTSTAAGGAGTVTVTVTGAAPPRARIVGAACIATTLLGIGGLWLRLRQGAVPSVRVTGSNAPDMFVGTTGSYHRCVRSLKPPRASRRPLRLRRAAHRCFASACTGGKAT